jgi:hypothetical protein
MVSAATGGTVAGGKGGTDTEGSGCTGSGTGGTTAGVSGTGTCSATGGSDGTGIGGKGTPCASRTVKGPPAPACKPGTPKCSASSKPCSSSDTSSPQARRRWDGSMEEALAAAAAFDMLICLI